MRKISLLGIIGLLLVTIGCGGGEDPLTCGEGTKVVDGECVLDDDTCGAGTVLGEDNTCEPAPEICGEGTSFDEVARTCVPDSQLSCGANTEEFGGECVPADSACMDGTVPSDDGTGCVIPDSICGEGTQRDTESGQCVPDEGACGRGAQWDAEAGKCTAGEFLPSPCDSGTPMELSDDITTLTTLPAGSCYVVTKVIEVTSGATLIVEEDVTLSFEEGAGLSISNGVLNAVGEEQAPIIFKGAQDSPGHWKGVLFRSESQSDENVLRWAEFRHAGSSDFAGTYNASVAGSLLVGSDTVRLTVENTTFHGGQHYGFVVDAPNPVITFVDNVFRDHKSGAVYTHVNQGHIFDDASTYGVGDQAGENNRVKLKHQELTVDQIWAPQVPFVLDSSTTGSDYVVTNQATLTLEPGVRIASEGAGMLFDEGRLVAQGEETNKITLTGTFAQAGQWHGLLFGKTPFGQDNLLEHVVVEYAGRGGLGVVSEAGAVNVSKDTASLIMRDATVADSAGYGLNVDATRPNIQVESTTFRDNAEGAARVPANQAHIFDENSTFEPQANQWVRVTKIALGGVGKEVLDDQTWSTNVPFLLEGRIEVVNGKLLTIQPGATLAFAEDGMLVIDGGMLSAVGTENDKIRFMGSYPIAGHWRGLYFFQDTYSSDNVLQHVIIEDGGRRADEGNLILDKTTVKVHIDNVMLRNSGGAGIASKTRDGPELTGCTDIDFDGSPQVVEEGDLISLSALCTTTGEPFVQVAAGFLNACGLTDGGHLECWGNDSDGQVSGPNAASGTYTQLSAGYFHTCALNNAGTIECWGYDGDGQVSDPNAASGTYTQLTAGAFHTCALDDAGTIECWGPDGYGQVSDPNAASGTYTQISAGDGHTCALDDAGTIECWGPDGYGQVSDPNAASGTYTQISAGGGLHTCALDDAGAIECWGYDGDGHVSGPNAASGTYTQISAGGSDFGGHTCALDIAGEITCWGRDFSTSPPTVSGFTDISVGVNFGCSVHPQGHIACWGSDDFGQASPPPR